jgi:hypothetical protein
LSTHALYTTPDSLSLQDKPQWVFLLILGSRLASVSNLAIWRYCQPADISAYLHNDHDHEPAVGIATGILAAVCGLGDPVLWGTVAFLLNYVPVWVQPA